MEFSAVVLLRGQSKGIPEKNIRSLAGKPLFAWAIDEAIRSKVFSQIYISTEDLKIKTSVEDYYDNSITVLDRPVDLSTDSTTSDAVVKHHLPIVNGDVITLLQITSPLTSSSHFQEARDKFIHESADSLLTVVREKLFFWDDDGTPLNYNPQTRPMRQEFEGVLVENGAFYMTKRNLWEDTGIRLGGNIVIYEMPELTKLQIDEPLDWKVAEALLETHQAQ